MAKSSRIFFPTVPALAESVLLVAAGDVIRQSGIPVTVVYTVSAGDAFTAAILPGLLGGEATGATLRHSCKTAFAVCAHAGAIPLPP